VYGEQEAAERGLLNLANTVQAVERFAADKNKQLFTAMGVFSEEEVNARQEVMYENYTKQLLIEVCIFFY
jgi:glutamine synthetase